MGKTLLLMGKSGTGKTYSLRTLDPETTAFITPNSKELPWKGSAVQYNAAKKNYATVNDLKEIPMFLEQINKVDKIKTVILEDTTHLQNRRMFSEKFVSSTDWGKWNRFGADYFAATIEKIESLRDDLTVIVIAHVDLKEDGYYSVRTSGKLLDNTIDIPSWFTVILHSRIVQGEKGKQHVFQTESDGNHLAKSPVGMFSGETVPNDMKAVLESIHNYYHIEN